MKQEFQNRAFQLWHYNVSHGELLVRSPKGVDSIKNIDILFWDVKYMELPRFLPGLIVDEVEDEDISYVQQRINKWTEKIQTFVLTSDTLRYFIVAGGMKIIENELDLFELPFN